MTSQNNQEFVSRLEQICTQYAEKTAITYMRNDGSKTLFTFGEILERIHATKENFADVGLRTGDRVAIIAPSSPNALFAVLALAYSNIASVLLDESLPKEEIKRLLKTSDVRAVFTTPKIYDAMDSNIIVDIPTFDMSTNNLLFTIFDDSTKLVSAHATTDPDMEVFAILFSSGTTANMKGVMITYASIMGTYNIMSPLLDIDSSLKPYSILFVLPINHIAGLISGITSFFDGTNIFMVEDIDATKLNRALLEAEPTHFVMVPRIYELMEQKIKQEIQKRGKPASNVVFSLISFCGFMRKKFGVNIGGKTLKSVIDKVFGKNIRVLLTGGSLCGVSTSTFFLSLGINMWADCYASTETNLPVTITCLSDRFPVGTVSNVSHYKNIQIKIHDPDEKGIGEIRVKTALIMKGYFRDPELTAAAFDEDGYFKTGDLGYIDKKDYLHVTGRMKEAIMMHTGKKVASSDVDTFYSAHCPDVALASCGVPNEDGTYDEIHLFVEKGKLSPDEQQNLRKSLFEFSAQTSTLYQVSDIHFIDKLPLTSIGKVKRFQLKEITLALREGG